MSRLVPSGPLVFDFVDLDADTMYSDYSSDITKKMVSVTCRQNCVIQVYGGATASDVKQVTSWHFQCCNSLRATFVYFPAV